MVEGVINNLQGRYDSLKTYFPPVSHNFDFYSTLIPESGGQIFQFGEAMGEGAEPQLDSFVDTDSGGHLGPELAEEKCRVKFTQSQ